VPFWDRARYLRIASLSHDTVPRRRTIDLLCRSAWRPVRPGGVTVSLRSGKPKPLKLRLSYGDSQERVRNTPFDGLTHMLREVDTSGFETWTLPACLSDGRSGGRSPAGRLTKDDFPRAGYAHPIASATFAQPASAWPSSLRR
jgi:hypothetical protein